MTFDENSSPAERLDAYRDRIAILEQACGAAAVAMMMDMNGAEIAASAHNSPFMLACRAIGLDPVNAPEKAFEIVAAIRAKGPIAAPAQAGEIDLCPICAVPFKSGDVCATDIEMGTCHAACLEGSPAVYLDTGEPSGGPIEPYPYKEEAPHPLEAYADSYAQMNRMGDGKVDCRSVEVDIRQNMIPVTQAIHTRPTAVPDGAETYYTKGKDAPWFESLSDKDFAWQCTRAAQDLADGDFASVEEWMPIVAIVGDAAERIERLRIVPDGMAPTHRHRKRGSEYVLLGIGKMQSEIWEESGEGSIDRPSPLHSVDMREVAIYRSVDDGSLWARPREEFEDGRFEPIPVASIGGH